jgi:hypothetical protein
MIAMQYATIFEHGRQLRLPDALCAPAIGAGWTPGSVSTVLNGPAAMRSSKCGEVPSTV